MQLWSYDFQADSWELESTTVLEEMLDLNTCNFVMAKECKRHVHILIVSKRYQVLLSSFSFALLLWTKHVHIDA